MPKTSRLASSQSVSSKSLLYRLQTSPGSWQFAQAIRVLLHHSRRSPVALSLVSEPGYRYTRSEVTQVKRVGNSWTLSVTLPSLSGLQGVLPYGYQDQAHQLRVGEDNTGLQNFYEIFNQRVLLNSYRVITRYRLACRFEEDIRSQRMGGLGKLNQERQSLAQQICALAGVPALRRLSAEHLVQYIGLLGQKTSSTALLEQILNDYFELPVTVSTVPLRRHHLDDECRTALSAWRNGANTLGDGALLGRSTWLASSKVELTIIVQDVRQKQKLERDTDLAEQLQELCHLYLGQKVDTAIRLQCCSDLLPRPQLSGKQSQAVQLGPHHYLQSGKQPDSKVLMAYGASRTKAITLINNSTHKNEPGC